MKPYAFGVDIGGTSVKTGLFRTDGSLLKKWEIPTRKEENGSLVLPDIAAALQQEMTARGITPEQIEGIGIGSPGPVLRERIVNRCANLGWGVTDVAARMAELTGIVNVRVGNDANVAALGEMWKGGGRGHQNVVMVTLGTGVGGGIIVDGRIVSGAFGAGGEIGHMKVSDTETECCGCGKKGCLEQYASATGLVRLAKKYLAENDVPSPLRETDPLTAKDIFDVAKEGDALALRVTETACAYLGKALSWISSVVDPEVYVIGGGVSKAGDMLTELIRRHFTENAFHASRDVGFALAVLGNDAGMYGAVKLVLQERKI